MRTSRRSGQALVEFAFTAIFLIFILISLFSVSVGMWQYHTLAEVVNYTVRTAAVHGAGCVGKTCATTVDQTARTLQARALGIPAGQINATLTSSASTVSCNPLSSCIGNSAAWPTLAGNTTLTDISITATVQFTNPVSVWVPVYGTQRVAPVTFGATSTQPVMY